MSSKTKRHKKESVSDSPPLGEGFSLGRIRGLGVCMAVPKVSGIRGAKEVLKNIDPEFQRALERDFHKQMSSPLQKVKKDSRANNRRVQNALPNLYNHRGRTRNTGADIKASFRPSAQYGRSVALITARGRNNQVGFEYAELAGINRSTSGRRSRIPGTTNRGSRKGDGSYLINGQGKAFNQALNRLRQPGRLAFDATKKNLPALEKVALGILEKMSDRLNEKLKVSFEDRSMF